MNKYDELLDRAKMFYDQPMVGELMNAVRELKDKSKWKEQKRGEWIKSRDDYFDSLALIECSLCHEEWCFEVDEDVELLNYNYCPNCGADMRKEKTNDTCN